MILIRNVHHGDAEYVAARMRQADRDEVMAWAGVGALDAARMSLGNSAISWTATRHDRPICIFGVVPDGLAGSPWALGTDEIDADPNSFARQSARVIGWMLAAFPRLQNWTDARHGKSHDWLRWLGFFIAPAQPSGLYGMPFHPFWMGA